MSCQILFGIIAELFCTAFSKVWNWMFSFSSSGLPKVREIRLTCCLTQSWCEIIWIHAFTNVILAEVNKKLSLNFSYCTLNPPPAPLSLRLPAHLAPSSEFVVLLYMCKKPFWSICLVNPSRIWLNKCGIVYMYIETKGTCAGALSCWNKITFDGFPGGLV